jgi:hypothetical protein
MRCRHTIILFTIVFTTAALAQAAAEEINSLAPMGTSAPAPANDSNGKHLDQHEGDPVRSVQSANMSEVAVGDHWIYEIKDGIDGEIVSIQKVIVTDVSESEVATRVDVLNKDESSSIIYDKSWNEISEGTRRFSPNSGTGVRLPLALKADWNAAVVEVNEVDDYNKYAWAISVHSRVTGQETITTKAGTFQAYIIETTQDVRSTKDPIPNSAQISTLTWFSPELNHWVRRDVVRRYRTIIRSNMIELVEYGRRGAQ